MREIDITKQGIRACDDIDITERHGVNVVWELWFEVDKYFGTHTSEDDSWVNFYTEWNYDSGDVCAFVCVDYPDRTDEMEWELTDVEKCFFYERMNQYCIELTGLVMKNCDKTIMRRLQITNRDYFKIKGGITQMGIWYDPDATDEEITNCIGDYYGCEVCIHKEKCFSLLGDKLEAALKEV